MAEIKITAYDGLITGTKTISANNPWHACASGIGSFEWKYNIGPVRGKVSPPVDVCMDILIDYNAKKIGGSAKHASISQMESH